MLLILILSIIHSFAAKVGFKMCIACKHRQDYHLYCPLSKRYFLGTIPGRGRGKLSTLKESVECVQIKVNVIWKPIKRARRKQHQLFWKTHMLYPLFYLLIILHGIEGILQQPRFHLYLIVPGKFSK